MLQKTRIPRAKKNLVTGIVVAVVCAVLALVIYKVLLHAMPQSANAVGSYNAMLKKSFAKVQFAAAQQESLRTQLAGFWEYSSDSTIGAARVLRHDRLEIKPNGYVWQVQQVQCAPPSGEPWAVTEIGNYFLSPFGRVSDESPFLICELAVLGRVFITGNDTCYSTAVRESTWVLLPDSGGLVVNGNLYQPYDTTGRLMLFFPKGALKLIDNVALPPCSPHFSTQEKIKALTAKKAK